MSDENDIPDLLKNIPKEKYPSHLKTATKAEFITMVRKNKKKRGCRDRMLSILLIPFVVGVFLQLTGS